MLHGLQRYRDSYQFSIEVVDVDADEALTERFDELVPVLFGESKGEAPVQLCHYFIDAEKVEQFLRQ